MTDVIQNIENEADKVEDAAEGAVADVQADAPVVEQEVATDVSQVKTDAETAGEQVITDAEGELADVAVHPTDVLTDAGQVATDAEHEGAGVFSEVAHDAEAVVKTVKDDVAAIFAHFKKIGEENDAAGPGSELHPSETPEAWANRFPRQGSATGQYGAHNV